MDHKTPPTDTAAPPPKPAQTAIPPQKIDIPLADIRAALAANEAGDAWLYIRLHRGRYIYVTDTDLWRVYQGHHWAADAKNLAAAGVSAVVDCYLYLATDVKKDKPADDAAAAIAAATIKQITRRVDRLRSVKGIAAILRYATYGADGLTATADDFDRDADLLGCRNGVIDLRNGRLRPGKPNDMIYRTTGIDYPGQGQDAPQQPDNFLQTLRDMYPDQPEMIDYLQLVIGSTISGHPASNMYMFLGIHGSNGKSQCIVNPCVAALGDHAGPVQPEVVIDVGRSTSGGPTPHLVALKGLRLGVLTELQERDKLAEGLVKAHTGSDLISAKPLYARDYTVFQPGHTLIIPTNHRPRMTGDDAALWRRVVFVPFSISFVDHPASPHERPIDRDRPAAIMAELPALLAWMVAGYLRWVAAGRKIDLPAAVQIATDTARNEEDVVGRWIMDCCVLGAT